MWYNSLAREKCTLFFDNYCDRMVGKDERYVNELL